MYRGIHTRDCSVKYGNKTACVNSGFVNCSLYLKDQKGVVGRGAWKGLLLLTEVRSHLVSVGDVRQEGRRGRNLSDIEASNERISVERSYEEYHHLGGWDDQLRKRCGGGCTCPTCRGATQAWSRNVLWGQKTVEIFVRYT